MISVLFVCLGNICRSPMAEAVFAEKVRSAGLEHAVEADSAGTGHWHVGEPPHRGTRQVLDRLGIRYTGGARLISEQDLERFDYIITMDAHNLRDVQTLGKGRAEVRSLLSFAPEIGEEDVPDPYYDGRFDHVHSLVDAACGRLLEHIRREHGL